jgi:hypothetical protein
MGERLTYIPPEARGLTEEEDIEKNLMGKLGSDKERSKWKHFTPEFVGTHVQEIKIPDLTKQINEAQRIYTEGRLSQNEGFIKIKSELPISIAFMGDLHLGSIYTSTDEVMRKIQKIKDTPNMYTVFMSNMIDNAIPSQFPVNMLANGIPPDKQVFLMRSIAEDLNKAGKVLGAVTSPCHEGWTYRHTGQDINALIYGFKNRKFPVLENGGRLHIKVGKQEYMGALYHQVGPFESNFNETHALRQLNRLNLGMEADFVVGAHRHFSAAETVYEGTGEHRKQVAYIRSGTEKGTGKLHDQFSIDRYGSTGEPTGQVLHLWGTDRRIITNLDFDTGCLAQECFYLSEMAKREGRR